MFDGTNLSLLPSFLSRMILAIQRKPLVALLLLSSVVGLSAVLFGGFFLWQQIFQVKLEKQMIAQATGAKLSSQIDESTAQQIQVYISGEVHNPGVYSLESNSRLGEAIDMAGGFTDQASEFFVYQQANLAKSMEDEEHLYVPAFDEKVVQEQSMATPISTGADLISINSATSSELESLTGIGAKRAEDIIANRPYTSIDDLISKKIISESVLQNIESEITL